MTQLNFYTKITNLGGLKLRIVLGTFLFVIIISVYLSSNVTVRKHILMIVNDGNQAYIDDRNQSHIGDHNQSHIGDRNQSYIREHNKSYIDNRNQSYIGDRNQSYIGDRNQSYIGDHNQSLVDSHNKSLLTEDTSSFLVINSGCKIPKLDPFHSSVKHLIKHLSDLSCGKPSLLTLENMTIRINPKPLQNVSCCFKSLSRKSEDKTILSNATCLMNRSFLVTSEFVQVECTKYKSNKILYRQFYPFVTRKPQVEKRIKDYLNQKNKTHTDHKFNIMMLGLDSVSKNQFLRHMLKTYDFIKQNLTYVELQGYNKVGKNTYANMVPMFTGKMEYEVPDTSKVYTDVLPIIWKEYMKNGYKTMFNEDLPHGSIFDYARKGFDKQPVDYYLRPWSLIVESYISKWKTGCLRDRIEANVILKWMEDFFDFFPNDPLFAFTFLTRMSHDYINELSYHDKPVRDMLERLFLKGHLNNTIVFFFGDHGFRFGEMRNTYIGRMEGRLPFMFLLLPSWFPKEHPKLYNNLKINEYRLTTALDIHATLNDILYFREDSDEYEGGGRSISLLRTKIPANRTCVDANIKSQWCACISLHPVALNDSHVLRSAKELVKKINSITAVNRTVCAELSLVSVINASKHVVELGEDSAHDGSTNFLVNIKVAPSKGVFEGSVWFNGKHSYTAEDTIERINLYRNQSACIDINYLKPYCYCTT